MDREEMKLPVHSRARPHILAVETCIVGLEMMLASLEN